MSLNSIRQHITQLVEAGILLTEQQASSNRVIYYSINYPKLIENFGEQAFLQIFINPYNLTQDIFFQDRCNFAGAICQDSQSHLPILRLSNNKEPNKIKKQPILLEEDRGAILKALDIWNDITGIKSRNTPLILEALQKALVAYFNNDLDQWQQYCHLVTSSKFLMGKVTNFQICLKWAIQPEKIENIMSGAYRCGSNTPEPQAAQDCIFNLSDIPNLTQSDIQRVCEKQALSQKQIQDSIYQFAYDYRKTLKNKIKDPVSYFMSILLRGKLYETQDSRYSPPDVRVGELEQIMSDEQAKTQAIVETVKQYKTIADSLEIKDISTCRALDVISESQPLGSDIYQDIVESHDLEHFTSVVQEKLDLSIALKPQNIEYHLIHRSLHGLLHDLQYLSKKEGRDLVISAVNNLSFATPYISYRYVDESHSYAQEVLQELETLLFDKHGDMVYPYIDQHYNRWKTDLCKSELDAIIDSVPGCSRAGEDWILGEIRLKEYFRKEILLQ